MERWFVPGVILLAILIFWPVSQATAFQCPVMVKENKALIEKAQKTSLSTTAKDKIAEARKLTDEAQKLHEGGDHTQAMIKAYQAATLLAETALASVK